MDNNNNDDDNNNNNIINNNNNDDDDDDDDNDDDNDDDDNNNDDDNDNGNDDDDDNDDDDYDDDDDNNDTMLLLLLITTTYKLCVFHQITCYLSTSLSRTCHSTGWFITVHHLKQTHLDSLLSCNEFLIFSNVCFVSVRNTTKIYRTAWYRPRMMINVHAHDWLNTVIHFKKPDD